MVIAANSPIFGAVPVLPQQSDSRAKCLLFAWFLLLVAIFSRDNDFPASWHPDEPGKVAQLLEGKENCHHPQLMLRATSLVLHLSGARATAHEIVVTGRWVSAVAAAGAVICLALLAMELGGVLAGLMAAVFVGTDPLLFGLAHYMKEDAIYVLGLSLFLLALVRFDAAPGRGRLIVLGIAARLAISGKYIGAVVIPTVVGFLIWMNRAQWRIAARQCATVLAWAAAIFLVIDFPIFTDTSYFRWAFEKEVTHVLNDHGGLVRPITSMFYFNGLSHIGALTFALFCCAWLVSLAREPRSVPRSRLIVGVFPIAYLVLLQVSPVKIIRYELPIVVNIEMLGACTLAALLATLRSRPLRALVVSAAVLLLSLHASGMLISRAALAQDTRNQMARWIETHVERDAVMMVDRLAGFGFSRYKSLEPLPVGAPQNVIEIEPATLAKLRNDFPTPRTYVLVADSDFGRYFNTTLRVNEEDADGREEVARYRAFYTRVFERGKLLQKVDAATPTGTFFSPGLWLFEVERESSAAPPLAEPPSFTLLQD